MSKLFGVGRNAVASVVGVGGTTIRGVGDAVFHVGSATESVASGTGQVRITTLYDSMDFY